MPLDTDEQAMDVPRMRCSSISASSDAHFSLVDASCRQKAATLASRSFFSAASLSRTVRRMRVHSQKTWEERAMREAGAPATSSISLSLHCFVSVSMACVRSVAFFLLAEWFLRFVISETARWV